MVCVNYGVVNMEGPALSGLPFLFLFLLIITTGCGRSQTSNDDVRISWDYRTNRVMSEARVSNVDYTETGIMYSRVRRLQDSSLLMSFMDAHFGNNVYIRRSTDDGATWGDVMLLKQEHPVTLGDRNYNLDYVNPDFIQLRDGRIILAYQWRLREGYGRGHHSDGVCGVEIMMSNDSGLSWSESREVFRARCWEPSLLELESGELQMFVTVVDDDNSYIRTVLLRSFDSGLTWQGKPCADITDAETVSQTVDTRFRYDGMPSAVELDNGSGMAMPLEVWADNLVMDQTPVIVRTSREENWRFDSKTMKEEGGPQWPNKKELNKDFNGYGPYCCKLPTGEVLVTSNGTYKGEQGQWVFIGNSKADNFSHASSPLEGYWGCISYIGGRRVLLTTGEKYSDKDKAVRYRTKLIEGKLNYSKTLLKGELKMESLTSFDEKVNDCWFLGGKDSSRIYANFGYTSTAFKFGVHVFDDNIISFTPENSDAAALLLSRGKPGKWDNYQVVINAEGEYVIYREYTNSWHLVGSGKTAVELDGTINDVSDTDRGFSAHVDIAWSLLGGKPKKGETMCAHLRHYIKDAFSERPDSVVEEVPGENTDHPDEWLTLTFK